MLLIPASDHSDLSPSHASCWSVCTASVGYVKENERLLPPDVGSPEADEGTRAHKIADARLKGEKDPFPPDDEEMDRVVNEYVAWVRSDIQPRDMVWFERKIPLFYKPAHRGTLDNTIFNVSEKRIRIKDLKYGKGVSVDAERNKQLAIYAESVIRLLETIEEVGDDWTITIEIYQPRDRSNPVAVRQWILTRGELRTFVHHIQVAADDIESGDPSRVVFISEPATVCRWCRGKKICKTYAAKASSEVSDEPVDDLIANDFPVPDPKSLTREQRIRVIKGADHMREWLDAVEAQEVYELMDNAPSMGFKLVEGKSNRKWRNQEEAQKLLKNYLSASEIVPPASMVSPAGAEELLKGKKTSTKFDNKLAALIEKPPGKPTLVPVTDKREALSFDPSTEIQNLDKYELV